MAEVFVPYFKDCARSGCSNKVHVKVKSSNQKYCSIKCSQACKAPLPSNIITPKEIARRRALENSFITYKK
jgi:hypothetical protein